MSKPDRDGKGRLIDLDQDMRQGGHPLEGEEGDSEWISCGEERRNGFFKMQHVKRVDQVLKKRRAQSSGVEGTIPKEAWRR